MTAGRLRPPPPPDAPQIGDVKGLASMLGARVFVSIVVPRTSIAGSMRLLSSVEATMVTVEARKHFAALGLPVDVAAVAARGVTERWNVEVAVRHLAIAVCSPEDTTKPLDTLEEWRQCDDDQIASLWRDYQDLAARIDPLGNDGAALEEGVVAKLISAAKKKDEDLLMSYGSRTLARFAITSVAPPAS